jgi:dTDP-4-amino-4,6-dideoxygalactose transaminase
MCDVPEIGWSAALNNLCSAIGLSQLTGVIGRIQRTRDIAELLRKGLADDPGVVVVPVQRGVDPAYWAFLVRIKNRDKVLRQMRACGVYTSKLHFRTDHYSGFGVPAADLPNTQKFLDTVLALPCGWWMSDADAKVVVNELKNAIITSEI